jgi:hypothetical protein
MDCEERYVGYGVHNRDIKGSESSDSYFYLICLVLGTFL